MPKHQMRDLVVLLPGITGSVLSKGQEKVWATIPVAATALNPFGDGLEALRLPRHNPAEGPPEVGPESQRIRATALFEDFHGVFGLAKIDGYTKTARMVLDNFDVIQGSVEKRIPSNFIPFPYDWRLSNRIAARQLKALVDDRLPLWREWSHSEEAKVILIAHSMGGLVARWWLEKLEGWQHCRALFTFGTPYRGSLNAVNYLANGYKKVFMDATSVMRSFPSLYELMPIYPALKTGPNDWRRVGECEGVPGIDAEYARDGLAFHREIETAVEQHKDDPSYQKNRYRIFPIAGVDQPTLQSAALSNGTVIASETRPPAVDAPLEGGDGTVPRAAAVPIEMSNDLREAFFVERHGSLQNNAFVLDNVRHLLRQLQSVGLEAVRGAWEGPTAERGSISLDLEDVYVKDEPVRIRARLLSGDVSSAHFKAHIEQRAARGAVWEAEFAKVHDHWTLDLGRPPCGRYRITVSRTGTAAPTPVCDVFDVTDLV